jgi:hypothetical protein
VETPTEQAPPTKEPAAPPATTQEAAP